MTLFTLLEDTEEGVASNLEIEVVAVIDRIPLNAPEFRQIAVSLDKYDPKSAISQLSALLTLPKLQANTVRLETLVHLAVMYCNGNERVPVTQIGKWLNNYLENSNIAELEDPPEDVFIGNVRTSKGNRRIFNGTWPSNDYFVQAILDVMDNTDGPKEWRDLLRPVSGLLALSELVAERLSLKRWHHEESLRSQTIEMPSSLQLNERARAVTFTVDELRAMGIRSEDLEPFVLCKNDRGSLASETVANSKLERCPLLDLGGDLILAAPQAVSPAIVRYILGELRRSGYLRAFGKALANLQARQVVNDGFVELRRDIERLPCPRPNRVVPPLNHWLFKYDTDKYLHVVLLHDQVDLIVEQGLSSYVEIPETLRAGLEEYLHQVSSHCRSLSEFTEGTTLLIFGGLGRNYALGFKEMPKQWCLSVLPISDFIMLAAETDGSTRRYLKLIKQKSWTERQGVRFFSIDGDYNIYCYWRQQNYKLVPYDIPLKQGIGVPIPSVYTLPVRQQVRNLTDSHFVETVDGQFVHTVRLHRGSYFKSLVNRPIYASLDHIGAFELAGVIETERGPSWLVVKPCARTDPVLGFAHEVWRQFIDLFGNLIIEMESIFKKAPAGAFEIRLNLDDVVVPEDYAEFRPTETAGRPRVLLNLGKRTAEVKFPPDFLRFFQQPENTGERMVLRSIGQALIGLYLKKPANIEETVLEAKLDRLLKNSAIRALHAFPLDPLQHLLACQEPDPNFSYPEDFSFAKLGLSEGCTSADCGKVINSKSDCKSFLRLVVEKIQTRLCSRLKQFDRASVIRSGLKVCEAASQDRERWKRTAQALFACYASTDDVHSVARQRELDRTNVSIAARTVIEMAICECPASGGRQLSKWDLDELLAEATLLIEVAMHSDAVYFDLTKPRIELQANGEYVIERSFLQNVVDPFVNAYYHANFERVARDYPNLYNEVTRDRRVRDEEVFEFGFENAFHAEFGLMPQDVREAFSVLAELAIQCDSVVVQTTLGNIKATLTADRGLTPGACDRFINTFSIFHRPQWETPPEGFRNNDLFPWRYNRRLSASVRPILVFGEKDEDKVIYGAGTLANGCFHLLDRSENGRLPQEFYASKKMKEYIGKVNDARGHAFARSVADQMRERKWNANTEVKMTELGAPVDLGDVDVLAWKSDGKIQLIECKRLTFARTIAEIANICKRFQGEAKDELAKHLRRVEWIRRNPQCLRNIVGSVPDPSHIDHRLVTNTQVPMKYMESLPIDPDKIGPLEQS